MTIIIPGRPPRPIVVEIQGGDDVTLLQTRERNVVVEIEATPPVNVAGNGPKGEKGDTGDYAPETYETLARNLPAASATVVWDGDEIASVSYASGVTKTFAYSNGDLLTATLSGTIPDGVQTVKTFAYSDNDLSGWSYSQGA